MPKAYIVLGVGHEPNADTARSILKHVRDRVSPYKRVRLIEFRDLPKTVSGKIRRVELRKHAEERVAQRSPAEFREDLLETSSS